MDFNETIDKLNLVSNHPIVSDCLEAMLNHEVFFNPGFIQEKEQLTSLYRLRLGLASDLDRDKYQEDEIRDWEIAINDLEKSNAKELRLSWVNSEEKKIMLFWNTKSRELEALFYTYSRNSIKEMELFYNQSIETGCTVSAIKFKSGIEVKRWQKNDN